MTTKEAIKFLESLGHKVYPKEGKFAVWHSTCKNNWPDCRYSERELVRYAKSQGTPKGDKIVKKIQSKHNRRKINQLIKINSEEIFENKKSGGKLNPRRYN